MNLPASCMDGVEFDRPFGDTEFAATEVMREAPGDSG